MFDIKESNVIYVDFKKLREEKETLAKIQAQNELASFSFSLSNREKKDE